MATQLRSDHVNAQGIVSIRFNPDEIDTLREAASSEDRTLSAFIRNAALIAELKSRPGATTWRSTSGAEITLWMGAR